MCAAPRRKGVRAAKAGQAPSMRRCTVLRSAAPAAASRTPPGLLCCKGSTARFVRRGGMTAALGTRCTQSAPSLGCVRLRKARHARQGKFSDGGQGARGNAVQMARRAERGQRARHPPAAGGMAVMWEQREQRTLLAPACGRRRRSLSAMAHAQIAEFAGQLIT
jgi:hypothetical protein